MIVADGVIVVMVCYVTGRPLCGEGVVVISPDRLEDWMTGITNQLDRYCVCVCVCVCV